MQMQNHSATKSHLVSATRWLLIGMFLAFVLVRSSIQTIPAGLISALHVFFLLTIATLHALVRYNKKELTCLLVITFVISNSFENLSIITGFPFGHYHYSDSLGPKLFLVPLVIAPAYFGVGYLSWTLAHVLLGIYYRRLQGSEIVVVPIITAMIMVMWDLVLDPIAATVHRSWIWHDGGSYFGVPFSNYLGWLLCVYTVFQCFAVFLNYQNTNGHRTPETAVDRPYWLQASVTFTILGLNYAMNSVTGTNSVVTDQAGQQWQAIQIYNAVSLVTIFTIWFVAFLSSVLILRAPVSAFAAEASPQASSSPQVSRKCVARAD